VIYQISGVCRSFIFSGIPSAEWGFLCDSRRKNGRPST
jgi:hypothetical protein